jgi:hypothetical protein
VGWGGRGCAAGGLGGEARGWWFLVGLVGFLGEGLFFCRLLGEGDERADGAAAVVGVAVGVAVVAVAGAVTGAVVAAHCGLVQ